MDTATRRSEHTGPQEPRSVDPDWPAARNRVREHAWAREILARVREDFERWDGRLEIPGPAQRTEWTHHYFCDDGSRLDFDPTSPHAHRCPTCGVIHRGELLDGAWRTKMHNLVASHAQRAALLVRLDESAPGREAAAHALERTLAYYAEHYGHYPLHGDRVGEGRVMPQNLDESIWVIALLRAARWAQPHLTRRALEDAENLAGAVAAVLEPQLSMVHNIHCWILGALAECAARTRDTALRERIRGGPFGVSTQIREGFRAEGIWYETSLFYHYYTLAALLSYREATGPGGLSETEEQVLGRAVAAPAHLAYSDGLLPAYGDCWPHLRLGDVSGITAAAAQILPSSGAETPASIRTDGRDRIVDLWIGAQWDDGTGSRPLAGPSSVAALVFGPGRADQGCSDSDRADQGRSNPERAASPRSTPATTRSSAEGAERSSFLWPETGIGVLRSERARLTLRFGRDVGMHDHHDKLGIDAETCSGWRSLDPGSGGYTSAMTHWTSSATAHNLGIIHDEPQPPVDGSLVSWSPRHVGARIAWGGNAIHRTLRLTDDGWIDTMRMETATPGPLLWVFHGDGDVVGTSQAADPAELGSPPGSGRLENVRRLHADPGGLLQVTWSAPGSPRLRLTLPAGARALAASAPGNPTGQPFGILAIRRDRDTEMRIEAHVHVDPPTQPS